MTQTTAIGLFRHSSMMPTPSEVMGIYHKLEDWFRRLGVEPTHFSAAISKGVEKSGYKKFGGAFHKKVLGCKAEGYYSLGLSTVPEGSDGPAYDGIVQASLTFAPEANIVTVSFLANEPYLDCGSSVCDEIVDELAKLWQWDYGFGFERDANLHPDVYLWGGATNHYSAEDERHTELWYATSFDFYKGVEPPRRLMSVRDIFPYNIVGPGHLERQLFDGRSLRSFIQSDPDNVLLPLGENLWLWKVDCHRTDAVREKLRGSAIVITE